MTTATRKPRLIAEEDRKAVEKTLADSRISPRAFHLTAADAIREAMDGSRWERWERWERWDDVLQPFQDHLDKLKQDTPVFRLIEALLEQAQEKLEAHLLALDALHVEALALLGERP